MCLPFVGFGVGWRFAFQEANEAENVYCFDGLVVLSLVRRSDKRDRAMEQECLSLWIGVRDGVRWSGLLAVSVSV